MLGFDLFFFAPAVVIVAVAIVLVRRESADRDVVDVSDVPSVDPEFLRVTVDVPLDHERLAARGAETLGGRLQTATLEAARLEAVAAVEVEALQPASPDPMRPGRARITARRRKTPLVAR